MTEQILRNALKEAQEKEQKGLLIWASWEQWDDLSLELRQGNSYYDFALEQIEMGGEATIEVNWQGLSMPGIIAVSVQKMISSDDFFDQVCNICQKGYYTGPITLIPANQVSEACQ